MNIDESDLPADIAETIRSIVAALEDGTLYVGRGSDPLEAARTRAGLLELLNARVRAYAQAAEHMRPIEAKRLGVFARSLSRRLLTLN